MKIQIGNNTFDLFFRYATSNEYECWQYVKNKLETLKMVDCTKNLIRIKPPKSSIETMCVIKHNGKIMGVGQAVCSFKDNFCKETGRLLSLQRALEGAPNEQVREAFLEQYHNRKQKLVEV